MASNTMTMPHLITTTALGPRSLKDLKKGAKIQIYHKPTPEAVSELVLDSFPRNIAAYFSTLIKDELQSPVKQSTSIVLRCGTKPDAITLFKWMASSCEGFGIVTLDPNASFQQDFGYLALAKSLQIPILVNQLESSMRKAIKGQLAASDVKFVYTHTSPNHPYRELHAQTTAEGIEEKRLRDWPLLIEYQEKNDEYHADVQAYLNKLRAPRREAARAVRKAEYEARQARRAKWEEGKKTRLEEGKARWEANQAAWKARNQVKCSNATVQGTEVRRAANGIRWVDITKPALSDDPRAFAKGNKTTTTTKLTTNSYAAAVKPTPAKAEPTPISSVTQVTKGFRVLNLTKPAAKPTETEDKVEKETTDVKPEHMAAKDSKAAEEHAPVVGRKRKEKKH